MPALSYPNACPVIPEGFYRVSRKNSRFTRVDSRLPTSGMTDEVGIGGRRRGRHSRSLPSCHSRSPPSCHSRKFLAGIQRKGSRVDVDGSSRSAFVLSLSSNRIPSSEVRLFPVCVRHPGRQRGGTLRQKEKGNEASPFSGFPLKTCGNDRGELAGMTEVGKR